MIVSTITCGFRGNNVVDCVDVGALYFKTTTDGDAYTIGIANTVYLPAKSKKAEPSRASSLNVAEVFLN